MEDNAVCNNEYGEECGDEENDENGDDYKDADMIFVKCSHKQNFDILNLFAGGNFLDPGDFFCELMNRW